ncbi:kinase-like domain-containing protein [Aspergillus cavernicola]|uniref:Kinase-like domain-containing protein n=1 Tax=Aspergillus cavernicola TaxID=176166 RepID=A0ABR4I2E5_9EURO
MREPLWIFQRRFVNGLLPLRIAKTYIYFLLVGLDYLHSECKVVHIDLKLANILMTFENENILPAFVQRQQQMQFKVNQATGRTIYRCHNAFGSLDAKEIKNMYTQINDFGSATSLNDPSVLRDGMAGQKISIYPIQPDHSRAPEVILGCGWDFMADSWNLDVLLWNIIGRKELFQQVLNIDGIYDAKAHLAEMNALLGPPPNKLLEKETAMAKDNWPYPVTNETAKLCANARELFGGLFFTEEGKIPLR